MQLRADLFAYRTCHLRCGSESRLIFRDIQIRFVERQGFDQIGMALEDFAHLMRDGPVAWKIRGQEHGAGTQAFGANCRHGGTHAELSRFIRSGAHNGPAAAPRDNDRLTPQRGIIPLLYGRIKRVHVDMNDLARSHPLTILYAGSG
jgi:hypothetical protein